MNEWVLSEVRYDGCLTYLPGCGSHGSCHQWHPQITSQEHSHQSMPSNPPVELKSSHIIIHRLQKHTFPSPFVSIL